MRLIDADALLKKLSDNAWNIDEWELPHDQVSAGIEANAMDRETVEGMPTVDAEPVRHGKWKDHKDYPGLAYLCSECGCFTTMRTYRYCPYCGAVMRGYENGGHI